MSIVAAAADLRCPSVYMTVKLKEKIKEKKEEKEKVQNQKV